MFSFLSLFLSLSYSWSSARPPCLLSLTPIVPFNLLSPIDYALLGCVSHEAACLLATFFSSPPRPITLPFPSYHHHLLFDFAFWLVSEASVWP